MQSRRQGPLKFSRKSSILLRSSSMVLWETLGEVYLELAGDWEPGPSEAVLDGTVPSDLVLKLELMPDVIVSKGDRFCAVDDRRGSVIDETAVEKEASLWFLSLFELSRRSCCLFSRMKVMVPSLPS